MAGRLNVLDSWTRYAYHDIDALDQMRAHGNEFVKLDPAFIKAAHEAAAKWSDAQAAASPWFKRALDNRRKFQTALRENWSFFRFPIGM